MIQMSYVGLPAASLQLRETGRSPATFTYRREACHPTVATSVKSGEAGRSR